MHVALARLHVCSQFQHTVLNCMCALSLGHVNAPLGSNALVVGWIDCMYAWHGYMYAASLLFVGLIVCARCVSTYRQPGRF